MSEYRISIAKASDLADRVRAQAAISSRPGQLLALEAIADELDRLDRTCASGHVLDSYSDWCEDCPLDPDVLGPSSGAVT